MPKAKRKAAAEPASEDRQTDELQSVLLENAAKEQKARRRTRGPYRKSSLRI